MGLLGGILSGLGGVVGDIIGAHDNKKAVKKAGRAQMAFLQQAIDQFKNQGQIIDSRFLPFVTGGTAGFGQLTDLLGINGPEKQQAALGIIQNSPVLARMIDQGTEGVLQNASATGGLRGGNTERGLADFRADAFNQVLQDQLQRLSGVSTLGANAVNSSANFGADMASNIAALLSGQGQVKAGTILGKQQVDNNLSNQISSLISSIMMGGMGGGGGMSLAGAGAGAGSGGFAGMFGLGG